MSSKLKKAIDAVKDRTSISLAKVSSSNSTSSNLEVAILKATPHDADAPVDEKSICQVLVLVSSNKIYAAACARAIGKRIGRTRNWVVALKSLMLVLRIFQDGDPYFPREVLHTMKRGARILNMSAFRDDSKSSPWEFTLFVRTVALYIDERLECFLTGKLQRRYIHDCSSSSSRSSWTNRRKQLSGRRSNESIWDIKPVMLIDKLTYWQKLLNHAIDTKPTSAAKMNTLVQVSFYAIVRESFDLYRDISDGIAHIIDSFFHLQYQNCASAFQICVESVKQFYELKNFYAFCKEIGVGRISEYPTVQAISDDLIEELRDFLEDQSVLSNGRPINQTAGVGTQCASLDDLISAGTTGIDLEAYSPSPQRGDAWVSDTMSTHSLPVLQSIHDLVSFNEQNQQKQRRSQKKQKDAQNSSDSNNWEIALTETLALPLSDNFVNTFNAFPNQPPPCKRPPAAASIPANGLGPPPNYHYNPFLQDPMDLVGSPKHESRIAPPTFEATPTFSTRNPNESGEDPFADYSEEEKRKSRMDDKQKLKIEQQTWLQNQRKLMSKNFIC